MDTVRAENSPGDLPISTLRYTIVQLPRSVLFKKYHYNISNSGITNLRTVRLHFLVPLRDSHNRTILRPRLAYTCIRILCSDIKNLKQSTFTENA